MVAGKAACAGIASSLEAGLRSALRSNLHALVSALLIMGLFIGTTGLAAFLSVRVAQEGRATVLAVRDVFPAAWSGMAASTPLLAEAVAGAPEPQAASGNGSPSFLSTHPSGVNRIQELQANLPKVQQLYEQARRG